MLRRVPRCLQLRERLRRDGVALREVLDQLRMVQCRAPIPQGRHDGGAKRAGRDTREIHQAGSRRDPLRCQAGQSDRNQRNEETRQGRALDQRGHEQRTEGGVRVEVSAQEQNECKDSERHGDEDARIDAIHHSSDHRREKYGQQPDRRKHEAGQGSRIAHVLLQPQRQQDNIAEKHSIREEHGQRAHPEVAAPKQTEVDDRVLLRELPDHE